MISSHVKIWYPQMWRYRWFHWYQVCPSFETSSGLPRKSSAIFGNFRKFSENVRERSSGLEQFWKIFGNLRKVVGILRKIIKNAVISMSMWQKDNYTLAWSDEFYVLVARTISHSFAALTREILFLPLEHKIHIFSLPCNILYIFFYYINISGIPSGNKLIKTIRYPHM